MVTFLPSVTTALWACAGQPMTRHDPLDDELRALTGAEPARTSSLDVWRDLGERYVLVALPCPGRLGCLPRGPREFRDAAMTAGECLFSPTFGGALVPEPSPGEDAPLVWWAYETEPTDVRRVEGLDPGDARQELNLAIDACIARLQAVDENALADLGDAVTDHRAPLSLPAAVAPRLASLIDLAHRVLAVAELRHDPRIGAMTSHGTLAREAALADLGIVARGALETATNAAALALGRQR